MITETDNLPQTQLRQVIAGRLRSAILEGEIKPGDWLRQEQLAEKFGVSQTPVREALKDLVAEGLVEHVPYRGVRVIEFSSEDMVDLYACRAFMEGLAARYAARNMTGDELAELERVLAELEQNPARDNLVRHRELNRHFHQIIYTASRHAYLVRTLDQMWTAFPTMMLTNFAETVVAPIPRRGASSTQEHRDIVAALKTRNGEEAERLMQLHIQVSAERIAAVLNARQANSDQAGR